MNKLRALGVLIFALVSAPFLGVALALLFLVTLAWMVIETLLGKEEWDFTTWWNPKRAPKAYTVDQYKAHQARQR